MRIKAAIFSFIYCIVTVGAAIAEINPEADLIFRQSSEQIAAAKKLSFKAEVWEDAVIDGHKVSTSRQVDVQLRRQDGAQVVVRSPGVNRSYWYNGKTLTILNEDTNLYGVIDVPDTLDALLDEAQDKYGVTFALEDFLVADPYANAIRGVDGAVNFGRVTVLGTACRHIAFSNNKVDFQLWISDEPQGLPRKFVITFKKERTQPQITVVFSEWNLQPSFTDELFTFNAPKDSAKIEMLPSAAFQ